MPELNADFNAIAEPLRLTRISPNAYALGQGPVTFELTGTGFSSRTLLRFADGRTKAVQLINSKMLRVTMTDADFLVAGKVIASVATPLSASCVVNSAQVVVDVAPIPATKRVTVREFYNPTLDRYFVTADENEAKALQLNPYSLERQTGQTFQAWASTEYATGANVVYRFYGSVDPGPNGHFLTANVTEARALQRAELDTPSTSKRWNYEEMAFAIKTPQNGACPSDAPVKILRAYNNGFARGVDSNHRLLTDTNLYALMLANGWVGEGLVMCGPV